jgi:NitT/TauT family transport system ATP-binding protein
MQPRIRVNGVGKEFMVRGAPFRALDDVSLTVADQEFICIVGPSGCGKSTLLRMLGELETASTGEILINSADHSRPLICMVYRMVLP